MSAATTTLADFLLARIAEDEAGNGCHGEGEYRTCWERSERIERECEAKRRIVMFCNPNDGYEGYILRLMAAVYADHPDYRDEWRP